MFFLQIDHRPYAKNPKSKTRQTISLPRNTCFVKSLLWPPTMQFRKTCPKLSARIGRKVHSSSKITKTCHHFLSSKCSYGEVECSFNNPAVVFCAKSPNFFGSSQKEKTYPKIFFPNDPSGHLQGSSDRDATKWLARTLNCFCRKSEKTHKKKFSVFCPQIIPMKGWNSLLTTDKMPMFFCR